MPLWLILSGIGLATLAMKAAVPVFGRQWTIPPPLDRALGYVTPAVVSALVTTALFLPEGPPLHLTFTYRLLAGVIAAVLGWVSLHNRHLLRFLLPITIGVGLSSLWLLQLHR